MLVHIIMHKAKKKLFVCPFMTKFFFFINMMQTVDVLV